MAHHGVRGNQRSQVGLLAGTAVLAALATACTGGTGSRSAAGPGGGGGGGGHAAPAVRPVSLDSSIADGATGVRPDTALTLTAQGGTMGSVAVADTAGNTVPGTLRPDGTGWAATGLFLPATRYTVTAQTKGSNGTPAMTTRTFATLTPARTLTTRIAPLPGETVGVGMPIVVYLTAPVTDKAAVQRSLSVQMSAPVEGAWHWFGSRELHYRPKAYWPAGEKVTVTANTQGLDAGGNVWGGPGRTTAFSIGDAHVSTVDTRSHQMTVTSNGAPVRTIPVSTGRTKYPTTDGVHVVLDKSQLVTMDSATVGIPRDSPDGYFEKVYWDVRISDSGEYVHAAPWSTGSQGRSNVSHGCVNAPTAQATWFYGFSRRGDIVTVTGSPRPLEQGNGLPDWNMSWDQWVAGSAA